MGRGGLALLGLVAIALTSLFALPAASASTMQARVVAVIAEHGGTQTGWNEVSWDGGDVVLTLDPLEGEVADGVSLAAVGSCATARFCAYSAPSLAGSRLTFTSCSTHSTAPLATVRSVANARSTGTVVAMIGAAPAAVVGAGSWSNTAAGVTTLVCT